MKKFLSAFIAAALILTVSACGNNTPGNIEDDDDKSSYSDEKDKDNKDNEDNDDKDGEKNENFGLGDIFGFGGDDDSDENTPMTETTTSAPETEATTSAPETEATTSAPETEATTSAPETEATTSAPETEATTSAPEGELIDNAFLDGLKGKSPLYYEFGKITSTVPVTIAVTLIEGESGMTGTMKTTMASLSRIAMVTETSGESARVILENGKSYIINDKDKYVIYYSLPDGDSSSMEEEMANAMKFTAPVDFDKAEFSSGTETFMGESLKFETVDDGSAKATLYFDPATGRARYIVTEGQTVRIDDYFTGTDSSLFDIPADYEMIDLGALMAGN